VTLVQVTFDNCHQGALALGARETKDVATGSVAPKASALLLLRLSGGPCVTGVIKGATWTVRCDGHARQIIGNGAAVRSPRRLGCFMGIERGSSLLEGTGGILLFRTLCDTSDTESASATNTSGGG